MGLSQLDRYFFDVNGYVVLRSILSRAEVRHLNEVLDRQGLPEPGDSIKSQRFSGEFLSWDPACLSLLDYEAVLPAVKELCGPFVRLDHAYGIIMSPGTSGLGLHGGATPYDPAQHYAWKNGRMFNGLIVVSFALVDTPPGAGGFCCVPGSHKANLNLPSEVTNRLGDGSLVQEVPHAAGDVVIFTEALTHGTLPWAASYVRRNLLFKFSPGNSAWDKALGFSSELYRRMTPRQKQLVEPPYVGNRQPVP